MLAGGAGERLYPLTKNCAKPSVPFAGAYRIIDVTLSNCINSGLRQIYILTQHKALTLNRHIRQRLAGLADETRPGKPRRYDADTEKRILQKLDDTPPCGQATWTAPRVCRRRGISLCRRRSWCLSTDPEFSRKAANIVGLYLHPPDNAIVLAVDEKPNIQALERAQGWLRLPDGKALTGFSHGYKRHGTTTLFAALEVATGHVTAGHYRRRRRREFLDFMNQLVDLYQGFELHVVLDNLNTHKPKRDRWLKRHRKVHLHYTPFSNSSSYEAG